MIGEGALAGRNEEHVAMCRDCLQPFLDRKKGCNGCKESYYPEMSYVPFLGLGFSGGTTGKVKIIGERHRPEPSDRALIIPAPRER